MAYNYNQKGIWRVVYRHSQFVELNQQNWNDVVIEEILKHSDFKEALEVINRVKGPK